MGKITTYFKKSRERVKRKRSPWNWILFPLSVLGIGISGFSIGLGLLTIQQHLIPKDVILFGRTPAGSFLMFVPIFFPSLIFGFMFANFIAWCIPPARRALDKEAEGVKGASFKKSMKVLSIVLVTLLIVVIPLAFLGVFNYFYVTPKGINIHQLFAIDEKHYEWSDIVKIETRCLAERHNLHLNYILHMKDKVKIDLFNESPRKFIATYDQIKPFIRSQSHIVYASSIGVIDIEELRRRFHSQYAEKIIDIIRNEN